MDRLPVGGLRAIRLEMPDPSLPSLLIALRRKRFALPFAGSRNHVANITLLFCEMQLAGRSRSPNALCRNRAGRYNIEMHNPDGTGDSM